MAWHSSQWHLEISLWNWNVKFEFAKAEAFAQTFRRSFFVSLYSQPMLFPCTYAVQNTEGDSTTWNVLAQLSVGPPALASSMWATTTCLPLNPTMHTQSYRQNCSVTVVLPLLLPNQSGKILTVSSLKMSDYNLKLVLLCHQLKSKCLHLKTFILVWAGFAFLVKCSLSS